MQIREQIDQFTKPLQGRLLPSNVILFGFYFLGLHLLISVFYSEIELLIKSILIEGKLDVFKDKSSWQLDILCLLSVSVLGYGIWGKVEKGYIFSDVSLFLIWTIFILYGRFHSSTAWQAEPMFFIKQLTYANILAWSLESAFLFIFLYNYLKTYHQVVEKYLILSILIIFLINLILACLGYYFAILESILVIALIYTAPTKHNYITHGLLQAIFIVIITVLLMLLAVYPSEPIVNLLCHTIFIAVFVKILWLVLKKEQIKPSLNLFAEDIPTDNDSIGRALFAKNLVEQLHSQTFTESFTVGILGEWGAGKSQFMKYMRNALDSKNDVVYLDFSPWLQSHNTKLVVVQHFFEALAEKYKPYSSALSKQLNSYQNKLFEAVPATGGIGMIWKAAKGLLNDWLTNEIDSEKINEALKVINKKTVIFIDDLDRLHVDEVLDILKVMRTAANFWNTVYIVGADKPRVIDLLKNKHSDEKFLDKFIQLEVHLTPIENRTLWDEFKKLLTPFLQSKGLLTYETELGSLSDDVFVSFFGNAMGNMRGVKRLFNMLAFDISSWDLMELELDFFDFMLLSIIKILDIQEYHKIQISHSEAAEKGNVSYVKTYDTGLANFIDRHKGNKEFKFYAIAKLWNRRQDKSDFPVRGIQVMKDAYFYEPSFLKAIKKDVETIFKKDEKTIFKPNEFAKVLEKLLLLDNKKQIFDDISKIKAFKFVDLTIARFLEFYHIAESSLFFEWKTNTQFLRFGLQLDNGDSMAAYIQFLDFIKKHKNFKALLAAIMGVDPNNTYYKNDILNKQVNIIEYFLDSDENKNIEKLIIIIDAFLDKAKFVSCVDSKFYQKIIKFITDNFDECINCNLFLIHGAEFFKFPAWFREIAKYEGKKPFALLEEMLDARGKKGDFYQAIQKLKNNKPDIINDTGETEITYKL